MTSFSNNNYVIIIKSINNIYEFSCKLRMYRFILLSMKSSYLKYINAYKSNLIFFLNQNYYKIIMNDYSNNLLFIIFYLF